jgi:hypothetical protein
MASEEQYFAWRELRAVLVDETSHEEFMRLLKALDEPLRLLFNPPPVTLAFDAKPSRTDIELAARFTAAFIDGRWPEKTNQAIATFMRAQFGEDPEVNTLMKIQKAYQALGKDRKDYPAFEQFRRALCDAAGVPYKARGWSEDNIRRALAPLEYE